MEYKLHISPSGADKWVAIDHIPNRENEPQLDLTVTPPFGRLDWLAARLVNACLMYRGEDRHATKANRAIAR